MPTWLRERGYRFGITAGDCLERPHVHVIGHGGAARWWLLPVGLASSRGYNRRRLVEIEEIVRNHETDFHERWGSFCGP